MIKRSLHDLRQRLNDMKQDREAVESGINIYENNSRGCREDHFQY